jgi:hypothetical protein
MLCQTSYCMRRADTEKRCVAKFIDKNKDKVAQIALCVT